MYMGFKFIKFIKQNIIKENVKNKTKSSNKQSCAKTKEKA